MPPVINREKCSECEMCVEICPMDVIRVNIKNGTRSIEVQYPDECWHCRACAIDCPDEAIKIRYPLSHMMLYMDAPNYKGGEQ